MTAAENLSIQTLARRGRNGYRQYRIPALAVTTAGTVLAAYDGRPNLDDLPNTIDLLLRRSTDHGQTWEEQQVIRTGSGLQGFGDPSLLVDADTSRTFCFHAAGTRAGFFESAEGSQPEDEVQHVDLSYSDDDGKTWSHRRLTAQLKRPGITGIFAAAGAGIQLRTGRFAGRLLQQMVVLYRGQIRAASAYSDDHGQSWRLGELTGTEANENKAVQLPDGRVLMNSRAPGRRLQAISTDGGHSYSELAPVDDLPDPGDNGSICAVPAEDGQLLLLTNNRDAALRRNTVLSVSFDDGDHWSPVQTICPGSSAYSTAALLADGSLGVLFERDGYQDIAFTRFGPGLLAPDALAEAAASYREDPGGEFTMVLRSITPARPERWTSVGEEHVISAAAGDWAGHTWKEIGQGYQDGLQVLGSREAQLANYGPVLPALRAGDVLAFTGRFANTSAQAVEVELLGNYDRAPGAGFGPASVPAGGQRLFFTPTYTVTAEDLSAGRARVGFEVRGGSGSWSREFEVDTAAGTIRPLPAR